MSVRIQKSNTNGQDNNAISPRNCKSWADQVNSELKSNNTSREESSSPEAKNTSNSSNTSQDRKIAMEFIDDVNEEKYKRLVQEEQRKTLYKRRHELDSPTNSPANSPNTSYSDGNSENSTFKNEKRLRHNSQTSSTTSSSYNKYEEKNPDILARRQKQIDYGKNTAAYEHYLEAVPRSERTKDHPRTPNKYGKYSRRAFDGLVKIWRKQLHHYDPPVKEEIESDALASDTDSD